VWTCVKSGKAGPRPVSMAVFRRLQVLQLRLHWSMCFLPLMLTFACFKKESGWCNILPALGTVNRDMVISYALAWDKPSRGENKCEQLDLIVVGGVDCQPLRLRGLVWSDEVEHV